MAEPIAINVSQNASATPARYTVPGAVDVEPLSAFAHFDGTAAASAFLPTLTFYSDAGLIIARVFPSTPVAAGGTADVTFAPFLGNETTSGGSSPVVAVGSFAPVATFITITSTNPAAGTAIVDAPSFVADGVSTYRIDVSISTADITRSGGANAIALLLHLVRNTTELGIIADWNLPLSGISYTSFVCVASALDLPPAGTTIYHITGVKSLGAGTSGVIQVYGDGITPPVSGTTHPGYVSVTNLGVV